MGRATFLAVGAWLLGVGASAGACSGDDEGAAKAPAGSTSAGGSSSGSGGGTGAVGGGGAGASGGGGGDRDAGADARDPGPNVDTSDPQLYSASFTADEADPAASDHLGTQLGFLDTRVDPLGILVVYLHGAGTPSTCGSTPHGEMLAGLGFHVMSPCYTSDYGVGNCGDDIEGCRLEAFEGVDHHPFVDITPPNSIEGRVTNGLAHLQTLVPQGDWTYFVEDGAPRWSKIVISGISHGASSSGVIGMVRLVHKVVMLSGPLDSGQAWLQKQPMTPIDRFFGFTHTADDQHAGHLQSFEDLGLVGAPEVVDGASPPYGGSHRLVTSAPTSDGHGSTQAGGSSPQQGGAWEFLPVWQTMYLP